MDPPESTIEPIKMPLIENPSLDNPGLPLSDLEEDSYSEGFELESDGFEDE